PDYFLIAAQFLLCNHPAALVGDPVWCPKVEAGWRI
ncbi:unnamed protein product, partial [marine sediment metagenome]